MEFLKSQLMIRILGAIGLILTVIAFQSNKHKTVVIVKMSSEMVFAIQYLLTGAYTGFALNFLGTVRNFTYLELEKREKSTRIAMFIYLGVFTAAAFITRENDGLAFIFPLVGKLCSTVAYSLTNARHIRILNVPTAVMWIIYNITFGMWEALISDSFSLISVTVAAFRFDFIPYFKKRKEKRTSDLTNKTE